MFRHLHLYLLAGLATAGLVTLSAQEKKSAKSPKPLRGLLVCGGCCHDYAAQSVILRDGIQARANIQIDILRSEDKSTTPQFPIYANPDWAKGYDVIIHDECAAGIKDLPIAQNVINAHKTIPAVNLHCAMHSFRTGTDDWFKFLGLQSSGHGPQEPIAIEFDATHPVTETLSNWTTIKEELYNNINVFDAKPLAMGKQVVKAKDGTIRTDEAIVVWTNETQGARSFSTTLGHNNDTVGDTRYLDLITRGLLWSLDKLSPEFLIPYTGPEGTTTILPAPPKEEAADKKTSAAPAAPSPSSDGAPAVKVTASSEESDKGNHAFNALDNNPETRWCAASSSFPAWLQLELPHPQTLTGISIQWESQNNAYQHKIEGSVDGKIWTVLADASTNQKGGDSEHSLSAEGIRFLKTAILGTSQGGWASIREIKIHTASTPVTLSASSSENHKNNFTSHAIDGDPQTRWCAASGSYPQWFQMQFDQPHQVSGLAIDWESKTNTYYHKVEGSLDGKTWFTLVDSGTNQNPGPAQHTFPGKAVKTLKLTVTDSANKGNFASIREITLTSPTFKSLRPAFLASAPASAKSAPSTGDPDLAKEGNIPPKIVKLTPEQEAEILKDVTVPEGFEVTLFANSAAANYPVFVAAAPNGDLYVSSDGNGSLGRNPHRGRVIRLRDLDGDGRADEAKVFCEVDSPRGLVWDKDRLYLVHPPHLSVFIDKDGDGVAEESKILVKDIAFSFADRPADHTTNGLSLGIDGWLYIAGGDFGFMKATGSDGKTLQHRGGGVIRVRPDGSNLEIYATGTRNILEVAISPTMDIFARDNTNDGGGWNVRFHHFPGLTDHGYPRLYMNFPEEIVQPLADYGGGSGCGAVYIDEPGFGDWNNAPFTVDWGTNALWHHQVKPKGGTFEETRKPEPFIKMTRPTDADVDGNSNVYLASWKGATFNWAGPDVGYIVKVKPKGFKPEPLPDFAKLSDADLLKQLESPSYRRRMEAERELLSRTLTPDTYKSLTNLAKNVKKTKATRMAAFETVLPNMSKLGTTDNEPYQAPAVANALWSDGVQALSTVALLGFENLTNLSQWGISPELINAYLNDPNILIAINKSLAQAAQLHPHGVTKLYQTTLGFSDHVVQHTAINSLAFRQDPALCFAILDESLDNSTITQNTLRALAKIHSPETVSGLIERLNQSTDTTLRQGILATLCRLYHHEGEWKGDSWGTRPDTRGPYYQPEPWSETPKIEVTLKHALAQGTPEETAFLIKEMNRNRIQSNEALNRILALAKADPKHITDAVSQLAQVETIPAEGIPFLIQAARAPLDQETYTPSVRSQAIVALTKTDDNDAWAAILDGLVLMKNIHKEAQDIYKAREAATKAFLEAPKLENHHQFIEAQSEKLDSPTSYWAYSALLNLSARTSGSPEAREEAIKKLDAAWADPNPQHRVAILRAVADLKHNPYADKVLLALDDPDKDVAKAADHAAKAMKLEKKTAASGPLVSTLKPADIIAQVLKTKGDVGLGEQIFARATCVACHTTKEDEAQKGPYLGNIAQTYKRAELAEAILDPNKSIAQGFATNLIVTKKGESQMGFVTFESADKVTIRTITATEHSFHPNDIAQREKPPISMMPPGLMSNFTIREFASLLDYLEALSKK
jgi:putative membrane-bound dehydrogenase-like protein